MSVIKANVREKRDEIEREQDFKRGQIDSGIANEWDSIGQRVNESAFVHVLCLSLCVCVCACVCVCV